MVLRAKISKISTELTLLWAKGDAALSVQPLCGSAGVGVSRCWAGVIPAFKAIRLRYYSSSGAILLSHLGEKTSKNRTGQTPSSAWIFFQLSK